MFLFLITKQRLFTITGGCYGHSDIGELESEFSVSSAWSSRRKFSWRSHQQVRKKYKRKVAFLLGQQNSFNVQVRFLTVDFNILIIWHLETISLSHYVSTDEIIPSSMSIVNCWLSIPQLDPYSRPKLLLLGQKNQNRVWRSTFSGEFVELWTKLLGLNLINYGPSSTFHWHFD